MKDRAVWAFLVFAVLVLGGIYLLRKKETPAPPAPGAPVVRAGRGGEPAVIPDGTTIDMSSGRPVVKNDPQSKAALEKSVREMEEAAKNVTFGPRPPVAEKKKAEPAPAAPKP